MKDQPVFLFNNRTLTKVYKTHSMKFYGSEDKFLQHKSVEEKLGQVEVIRLRNGNVTETSIMIEIQKIKRSAGKHAEF